MSSSRGAAGLLVAALCAIAPADELKLGSDNAISCRVLQENQDSVTVLYGDSILRFNRPQIFDIKKVAETAVDSAATETGVPLAITLAA